MAEYAFYRLLLILFQYVPNTAGILNYFKLYNEQEKIINGVLGKLNNIFVIKIKIQACNFGKFKS